MYRVVTAFADATDNEYIYNVGDQYPRSGKEVDPKRLEELSSNRNRCGVVFVVDETPKKASPEVRNGTGESETGVDPIKSVEAKRRPRKGQKKNA